MKIRKNLLATLLAIVPAAISADQIAEEAINAYFANYRVLDDHPGCNGIGQTPYEIFFEASDVRFSVVHHPTGQSLQPMRHSVVSGAVEPIIVERPRCYRTERRGTEPIQIEVACAGDQPSEDPFARLSVENASLSISARVEACLSFSQFDLLDGSWDAQLQNGLQTTSSQGSFLMRPETTCSQSVPAQRPFATLDYAMSGIWANPGDYSRWRRANNYNEAAAPSLFRLVLKGLPLSSANDMAAFAIDAATYFFVINEGGAGCPDGICELPRLGLLAVGSDTQVCP
ncbi:hypothetical protein SLH49_17310 [Cognatiyoonia sp. IB215446]|uniref:hypothetical protein n=1 Tax=Cognatiyoonia sp. IB215446 TaxID=3097355 RepID=UPI002A109B04|nr:hypothetical protein [Cognatiyoonia sp. IB215446]MDX8349746.1 hypothetical protein [Cognatiyoonia sp. IB215446]